MSFYAWKCTYFKQIISDNFTPVDFLWIFVKLTSYFTQIPTFLSDTIISQFNSSFEIILLHISH